MKISRFFFLVGKKRNMTTTGGWIAGWVWLEEPWVRGGNGSTESFMIYRFSIDFPLIFFLCMLHARTISSGKQRNKLYFDCTSATPYGGVRENVFANLISADVHGEAPDFPSGEVRCKKSRSWIASWRNFVNIFHKSQSEKLFKNLLNEIKTERKPLQGPASLDWHSAMGFQLGWASQATLI